MGVLDMSISEQTTYDEIEQNLLELPAANSLIEAAAMAISLHYRIIRFRGNVMIKARRPHSYFIPMDTKVFQSAAFPLVGSLPRGRMNDVFAYLCNTADDLTKNDRYILFGAGTNRQTVWDMEQLEVRTDAIPDDCIWRSPYTPIPATMPIKLIVDLAGGDEELYSDIMQSLAPLVMAQKPVGVIWWISGNMDGKGALFEAVNKLFPDQLTNLTVTQLNGGRSDTPLLNGALGNMAVDRSHQITNTEIYKSIGTHEDLSMHCWHSQGGTMVRGNLHHIFVANQAPTFYTRDLSIDRRTHIVPFSQVGKTQFTLPNSFYGQLLAEICRHAGIIKQQGCSYKWSGANVKVKKTEPILSHPNSSLSEFRW